MGAPNYQSSYGTFFDRSSNDFDPGEIPGATCLGSGESQEGEGFWSAAWSGGGEMRGKVEAAMKAADPGQLTSRADEWWKASEALMKHNTSMRTIRNQLAGSWQGDDADAALKVFDGHAATLYERSMDSAKITGTLRTAATNLKWCKDKWGHDSSTMGGFGNWVSGDEDRESADDYNTTVRAITTSMNEDMPQSVPSQIKGSAFPSPNTTIPDSPTAGGPGGGPGVGSAGPGAHGNVPMPGVTGPDDLPPTDDFGPDDPPTVDPPPPIIDPPFVPSDPGFGPGDVDYPGSDVPGSDYPGSDVPGSDYPGSDYPGGGTSSVPGVDTGTSLAGYDGGAGVGGLGAGGYGAGAGGAGLSGAGLGAGGAGLGAGGYGAGAGSGLAGGAGGLAGGAGGLAGGAGAGSGGVLVGAPGAGAGGAGARGAGMMPARGGGAGGDDDERQRNTWLEEDEDVWGGTDAPPGVIAD